MNITRDGRDDYTVLGQPGFQVIDTVADTFSDFVVWRTGGSILSCALHSPLSKKRDGHADVVGCLCFANGFAFGLSARNGLFDHAILPTIRWLDVVGKLT